MSSFAPAVFIDANVVIQSGKPPGGSLLARVGDLSKAGLINFVTTDLTILEVAKRHCANDYELVREFGRDHVRRALSKALEMELPAKSKLEIEASLRSQYKADVEVMYEALSCDVLSVDDVKCSRVFGDYAEGSGFFSGKGKKDQFPDAFIFERVKQVVDDSTYLFIVGADEDFSVPVSETDHTQLVSSIPALFSALGLETDAPEIEEFLSDNEVDLIQAVDAELSDWGLIGDVEDSYIESTSVSDVEIRNLIAFKSDLPEEPMLAVATVKSHVIAHFTHPDWDHAMYDSEDKVLLPFDDVQGETELEIDIDVSFQISVDEFGKPEAIETLEFRNSDFQYVELSPPEVL